MAKSEDFDFMAALTYAKSRGRSFFEQLVDIFRVVRSGLKMSPEEYYYYGLFEPEMPDEERQRFISDDFWIIAAMKTCDREWWAINHDKLMSQMVLQCNGAPVPTIRAVAHPYRKFPGAPTLTTIEHTATWLRQASYPMFSKPVTGVQSKGQSLLESFDVETDTLTRRKDEAISVNDFARQVWEYRGGTSSNDGHVFQEVLEAHPEILRLCGPGIGAVRVIVVLDEQKGPKILWTTWKVMVGGNIADNFWRGNMCAHVDPETGEVLRVIRGAGLDLEVVTKHPDTREMLLGAMLPDWQRMREVVLDCASLMPKVRFQGWDIGLCKQGPVIVESNTGSGFALPQLSSGKGFMSDEFRQFLVDAEKSLKEGAEFEL